MNLSSRKYPESVPELVLVPDLVMALTTVPLEPPCVASNRFDTNSNSAIASRLYFGWPNPPVWFCVRRRPSTFSWKTPRPPSSSADEFCRLGGGRNVRWGEVRAVRGGLL